MSRRHLWMAAAASLLGLVPACPASAVLHYGDLTPDFHKTDIDGIQHTLFQYRGKVVVLFLFGYN